MEFYIISVCFIIAIVMYMYDFVQQEKKKEQRNKQAKRMKKNRTRMNIDIR